MIKAVSEGIGIARIIEEFRRRGVVVDVLADAKAALGIIEREGVGRVRHIDVGILWLQQRWLQEQVTFHKVAGAENTSDMMTKGLGRKKADQFIRDMSGEYRIGRSGKTVRLHGGVGTV